jgi:heat shock protein HtpX
MVLAASKAREVTAEDEPELINVVREMTIASNLLMPRVYVIEDTAPNAFATGRDPQHSSIAVTTGLLEKLDREELQGVIGHEIGHVGNYDIRFALLVGVLVGSIALLADVFLRWTWWSGLAVRGRSRGNREGGGGGAAQLIVFVLAVVLAILAPIFARLVQLAVSRQREYLADATSVEFTRNPAGLERALAKIAEDQEVLEVANRATQHLYIVNPIKKFEARSQGLFSTHPPILDRINRLRALHGAPPVGGAEASALANLD